MSTVHESKLLNQWRKEKILFLILFHTSHWIVQFAHLWSNFECGPFDMMIMAPDWLICLHGYITPKVLTSELKWQNFLWPWQPLVEVTMVMKVFTSEPTRVQEVALLYLSGQKKFLVSPWWCWFDTCRLRDHSGLTLHEAGNPALRDVDCNFFAFLTKHRDLLGFLPKYKGKM